MEWIVIRSDKDLPKKVIDSQYFDSFIVTIRDLDINKVWTSVRVFDYDTKQFDIFEDQEEVIAYSLMPQPYKGE